jgi:hypothetical protein
MIKTPRGFPGVGFYGVKPVSYTEKAMDLSSFVPSLYQKRKEKSSLQQQKRGQPFYLAFSPTM